MWLVVTLCNEYEQSARFGVISMTKSSSQALKRILPIHQVHWTRLQQLEMQPNWWNQAVTIAKRSCLRCWVDLSLHETGCLLSVSCQWSLSEKLLYRCSWILLPCVKTLILCCTSSVQSWTTESLLIFIRSISCSCLGESKVYTVCLAEDRLGS